MPRPSTFDATHGVWVRPNFSLRSNRIEISWAGRNERDAETPRLLELADIALGIKKPNKKTRITPMHVTRKTEPYNQE